MTLKDRSTPLISVSSFRSCDQKELKQKTPFSSDSLVFDTINTTASDG